MEISQNFVAFSEYMNFNNGNAVHLFLSFSGVRNFSKTFATIAEVIGTDRTFGLFSSKSKTFAFFFTIRRINFECTFLTFYAFVNSEITLQQLHTDGSHRNSVSFRQNQIKPNFRLFRIFLL